MTEREIKTISFGRACREKLPMYLSSDQKEALYLGLREIYVNSLDAFVEMKRSGTLNINICTVDRTVQVIDDGPGIPAKKMPDGEHSVIAAFTRPHTGSHNDAREVNAIGTNGVGGSIVNHTASQFTVHSDDGKESSTAHFQANEDGAQLIQFSPTKSVGKTGVVITYIPDARIYGDEWFDEKELIAALSEMLKFYPKVQLNLKFDGHITKIAFPKGLKETNTRLYYESENVIIALGLGEGEIKPFGNRLYLPQGGAFFTHFKTQMTRTVNDLSGLKLTGSQIQAVFNGYVAIFVSNPLYSNQSKTAISNKDANNEISAALKSELEKFAKTSDWQKTIKDLETELRAEEAAERARSKVKSLQDKQKKQKSYVDPDKFTDCSSKDRKACELFVVEGLSAGSSLQKGRDPKTQGILRLRGKLLNVARVDYLKMLENDVIQTIINATGIQIGDNKLLINESKLRFGRIVIATDADNDGYHIASLILTFFWTYARELIKKGYIYIAEPYLYRVDWGKDSYQFVKDDAELKELQKKIKGKSVVSRMKGLGEASAQELQQMLLNNDRTIREITLNDIAKAEKAFLLMQNDVDERKEFISDENN